MTEQELFNYKFYCGEYNWQLDRVCDSMSYTLVQKGPHTQIVCSDCGRHIDYLRKPKNDNKRDCSNNKKFMDRHRESGEIKCAWCGISEAEWRGWFECDHILLIDDGGPDIFENTRPLCSACHTERHAQVKRIKRLVGAK